MDAAPEREVEMRTMRMSRVWSGLGAMLGGLAVVAQAVAATPDEATRDALGATLARAPAVRIQNGASIRDVYFVRADTLGLVLDVSFDYRYRSKTIPWAEIQAIEVRTKDRAGSALRRTSLGLFLGIPLGYAIGYGVVRGDLSDMNALAPPLFGVLAGATGLVGGAISGVAWPAQSHHWKRVWQSDTAGEAAVRDSAAADSLSR